MSEKTSSEDFEFPEFIEEKTSYLDQLTDIKVVGVYPQELVVLPNEWMTLQVTEPNAQKLMADTEAEDINLGIVPMAKGGGLPPVGSIGVGADIENNNQMLGKLHLVKIRGVVRFKIDEYVDLGKKYPMARITFFEDDEETEQETQVRPQFLAELRELVDEFLEKHGKKHIPSGNLAAGIKDKYLEGVSFFFWTLIVKPIPAELRTMLLKIRSTVERTYLLNQHLRRTLDRLDKIKQANSN